MRVKTIFCLLVSCYFMTNAFAATTDEPELYSRTKHYSVSYKINDDGSFTEERNWQITVLKEKAVEHLKKAYVSYSTSIEKSEVLEAYTQKADGQRITVPKSNYQIEADSGKDKDAPVFSDRTTLTVIFPEVAVGDTVVFSYKLTAVEPLFPKQFSAAESFQLDTAYDDVQIKIDAPKNLWTQYEARALTEIKNEEKDGRKIIEWQFKNPNPIKNKRRNYSVYEIEKSPGFAFSTFKNYQEIAAVYGDKANVKAAVTDASKKLADELTAGKTDKKEIARVLYEWVATNITYAGNCVGLGSVVPHDLDFILKNKMGDCKDHATLLQSLLAAEGIDSSQALVNARNIYKLPKIPVVATVNHVINYLPEFKLFLDSTSDDTPFGMLPFSDADKPVLLVKGYQDGLKTPRNEIGENRQKMKTVLKINADGAAIGEINVNLNGYQAVRARSRFRDMSKEKEESLVKDILHDWKLNGDGVFYKDDPKPLLNKFNYSAKVDLKNFLNLPGAGAISIQPIFYSEMPVYEFLNVAWQELENESPVTCSNGYSEEQYTYIFPKGVKILSIPDNFSTKNDNFSYSASYKKIENTVQVTRIFEDKTPGNICTPSDLKAYQAFAQKVVPNFKSQILFK